jgi:hypothetical protein
MPLWLGAMPRLKDALIKPFQEPTHLAQVEWSVAISIAKNCRKSGRQHPFRLD